MVVIKEGVSLEAKGARTSDWIGQIKGGVLYAYDLSTPISGEKGDAEFSKEDFEIALKKVSRRIKK